MGVEGPLEAGEAGKRKEKRARVLLAAKIRTAAGEEDVRLRDLSRKGALIECDVPPPKGSEVIFARGTTVVPAQVAWAAGRRAGLEFLQMIDESEVLGHVGRPAAARTEPEPPPHYQQHSHQRFRRPRIAGEGLSAHDRKLAEVWGVQVGISVSDD